jgi:hypothetical protein
MLAWYAAGEKGQLFGFDIVWDWAEMALIEEK